MPLINYALKGANCFLFCFVSSCLVLSFLSSPSPHFSLLPHLTSLSSLTPLLHLLPYLTSLSSHSYLSSLLHTCPFILRILIFPLHSLNLPPVRMLYGEGGWNMLNSHKVRTRLHPLVYPTPHSPTPLSPTPTPTHIDGDVHNDILKLDVLE